MSAVKCLGILAGVSRWEVSGYFPAGSLAGEFLDIPACSLAGEFLDTLDSGSLAKRLLALDARSLVNG